MAGQNPSQPCELEAGADDRQAAGREGRILTGVPRRGGGGGWAACASPQLAEQQQLSLFPRWHFCACGKWVVCCLQEVGCLPVPSAGVVNSEPDSEPGRTPWFVAGFGWAR